MPWDNTPGKYPPNWKDLRVQVITRAGGNCQHPGCYHPGEEVDHIVNIANGGTHALNNLQLLCRQHHADKTKGEQVEGLRKLWSKQYHPKEKHPGIVDPHS